MHEEVRQRISQLKAAAASSAALDEEFLSQFSVGLSNTARARLACTASLLDCCIETADNGIHLVHRMQLASQSGVFRGMIADLPDTCNFPVTETAEEIAPLISYLHAPEDLDFGKDCRSAAAMASKLLPLARKYDVPDIFKRCDRQLDAVPQTQPGCTDVYLLAAQCNLAEALSAGQSFMLGDDLDVILKHSGTPWLDQLPGSAMSALLLPYVSISTALAGVVRYSQNRTLTSVREAVQLNGSRLEKTEILRRLCRSSNRDVKQLATIIGEDHIPLALQAACAPTKPLLDESNLK